MLFIDSYKKIFNNRRMEYKNISLLEFQNEYLKCFKEICTFLDNNSIHYSLAFGTMLGAAREQNIIPWDYDIDIYIYDNEWSKLECCLKNDNILYSSFKNGNNTFGLSRILIPSLYRQRYDEKQPSMAFIDLFHLITIDKDNKKIIKTKKLIQTLTYYNHIKYDNYIPNSSIKRFARKFLPSYKFTNFILNPRIKKISNETAKYVTPLYYNDFYYFYPKSSKFVKLKFGNDFYFVFENFDDILSLKYGDWKTPVKDGRVECMKFYVPND